MSVKLKTNRCELLKKISECIERQTDSPSDELIALGEALVAVGKELEGVSHADARATIKAVSALHGLS